MAKRIKISNKMSVRQAERALKSIEDEKRRMSLVNKARTEKDKLDKMKR